MLCSSLKRDIKIEGLVHDRTSLSIRVGTGSSRDIYGVEEVISELRKTDRRESKYISAILFQTSLGISLRDAPSVW